MCAFPVEGNVQTPPEAVIPDPPGLSASRPEDLVVSVTTAFVLTPWTREANVTEMSQFGRNCV